LGERGSWKEGDHPPTTFDPWYNPDVCPSPWRGPLVKDSLMLALSRGEGQSIIIDGHIEVKIVKWSRSSVRLAIQAPREVTVDRDEIWRKMNPGQVTPLEKAEQERKERFAQSGGMPPQGGPGHGGPPRGPGAPGSPGTPGNHGTPPAQGPKGGQVPPVSGEHEVPPAEDMDEPTSGTGT